MSKLLEVNNLATHFFTEEGIVKAVNGITYHLDEGEILGLVGESGCGKSVSALSIMRLVPDPPGRIVDGNVVFEGEDLLQLDARGIRRIRGNRVAMIFQEPMTSLNPVLTIERQIIETMMLHLSMNKSQARTRAKELLDMVGIPDPELQLKAYPHQLSGGMRQRVMIAIALSCNPKLIIADEPTTALDVTIQAQILELMQNLTTQLGVSLIIITHNLGVVARYAQRVLVMYAGNIIETGNAYDIYHKPSHPYTIGLLKSVPRLDTSTKTTLEPIKGLPPNLIDLPSGCSFAPRCDFVEEKCKKEQPMLMDVSHGHATACWRSDEIKDLS